MTEAEVLDIIKTILDNKSESTTAEVKSANGGFPRCYDTISAFSNTFGGTIIFGINEKKYFEVEGVKELKTIQTKIGELCHDGMEPVIHVAMRPIKYNNKTLLAVNVPELPLNKKPCYYKPEGLNRGAYTRIGDRDERLTDYEIYAFQSYNMGEHDDLRPNLRAELSDFNKDSLNNYLNKIKLDKPNLSKSPKARILNLCGITCKTNNNVFPTLASTLVFGEYPQAYFPQLFIACVAIPGTEIGETGAEGQRFDDNHRIEGTIEEMLEGALAFLRRNMKIKVIIDSNGNRMDQTEYPIKALREAIANALVHRDYSKYTENAYIKISVFTDRIEIVNPGALYGRNRLESLGTDKPMDSRNPNLVRLLEEKNPQLGDKPILENRHSGILTMRREMERYGLPEPEFINGRDEFTVIFRNGKTAPDNTQADLRKTTQASIQVNTQVSAQVAKKYNLILKYCKTPKSIAEITEFLKLSSNNYTRKKYIAPLIKSGQLNRTNESSPTAPNQKYYSQN